MRIKTSQQIKVGMFVSLGLVLSMVVIFLLGDGLTLFERRFALNARFNDVSGLRLGAPVFLAGIQVGKVEGFKFPEKIQETQIEVRMDIKREFKERIRQDSQASIVTQGLLGDKAVFITQGSPDKGGINEGEYINVKQALSLESFGQKGEELIENVNKLSKNIDGLVTDVKQKEGLLHALIYDPEGANLVEDLANVTQTASRIIGQVQKGRGMLHALIYDPVRPDIGKLFDETAQNMRSLSNDLAKVGSRIEKGEGSVGGLIKDPTVYYDLMTLLGKANRNLLLRTVIRATLATNEKDLNEK